MVERKLFKTKLCVLYQRGRCPRHNCSFAHGNAELRHLGSSHTGKRDYRGGDLRDKLDKRISPQQRYSPERNARGRHAFRGSGPTVSPERHSDRKRRKRQHHDGPNECSGSLKTVYRTEDRLKERKSASSELKEVQSDVNMLDQRISELKILLEEKVEEADSLTSIIQELEAQFSKEREESKRITSKMKKIVKAHKRYVRVQSELKRSEARFHKLCDQLFSGTVTTGGNREDSNINIVSDGEAKASHQAISLWDEVHRNSSPSKKSLGVKWGATEELSQANLINGGGHQAEPFGHGKFSQPSQLNNMEHDGAEYRNSDRWSLGNEGKQKRGNSAYAGVPSADKLRGPGSGPLMPSTSMAAHASDELAEVEVEEDIEVVENVSTGMDKGETSYKARRVPFTLPPPPPVPRSAYGQYQGEDADVDVEGSEDMVNVDIV